MKIKNKICKNSYIVMVGILFVIISAISANAQTTDEDVEPILETIVIERENTQGDIDENDITPGEEEPLIISPNPNILPDETEYTDNLVIAGDTTKNSESKDIGFNGTIIIAVFAGIIATILIIKRKSN